MIRGVTGSVPSTQFPVPSFPEIRAESSQPAGIQALEKRLEARSFRNWILDTGIWALARCRLAALILALAAAGCVSTIDRAPSTWYPEAELVCRDLGCHRCRGDSLVGCGPCRASGKVPCTSCRDGKEKCGTCKGDGSKGGKKCKSCGGDGVRNCSRCGGDRWMACGACEGKAQVHCLRRLAIREPIPRGDDAWPPGNEPN